MSEIAAGSKTYPVGTIAKLLLLTERRVQQMTFAGMVVAGSGGQWCQSTQNTKPQNTKCPSPTRKLRGVRDVRCFAPSAVYDKPLPGSPIVVRVRRPNVVCKPRIPTDRDAPVLPRLRLNPGMILIRR
jgi:hypothetical protein